MELYVLWLCFTMTYIHLLKKPTQLVYATTYVHMYTINLQNFVTVHSSTLYVSTQLP